VIIEREDMAGVIIPTEEILKKIEIQEPEPESPQQIDKAGFTIKVLNGSGIPGVAARTVNYLKNRGFKITGFGNADSFNYQETLIIYKIGKRKEAEFLNQFFDNKAELLEIETQAEDLVVVIGKNYAE
jgi:hypothetical protein